MVATEEGVVDIPDERDPTVQRGTNLVVLLVLITQVREEQRRIGSQITEVIVDPIGIEPFIEVTLFEDFETSDSRETVLAVATKGVIVVRLELTIVALIDDILRIANCESPRRASRSEEEPWGHPEACRGNRYSYE